jgi:hypothetical protein
MVNFEEFVIQIDYAKLLITHLNYFILIGIYIYGEHFFTFIGGGDLTVYHKLIASTNAQFDEEISKLLENETIESTIPTCYFYPDMLDPEEEEIITDQCVFDGDESEGINFITRMPGYLQFRMGPSGPTPEPAAGPATPRPLPKSTAIEQRSSASRDATAKAHARVAAEKKAQLLARRGQRGGEPYHQTIITRILNNHLAISEVPLFFQQQLCVWLLIFSDPVVTDALQKKYGNFTEDGYAQTFSMVFEKAVEIIITTPSHQYKRYFEQGVEQFNTVIKLYTDALKAETGLLEEQSKAAASAVPPPGAGVGEPGELAVQQLMGEAPSFVETTMPFGGTTKKKKNLKKKKKSTKAKKKRKNNIKSKRKLKLMKKTIKVKN